MFEKILQNIYANAPTDRFHGSHRHRIEPGFLGGVYEKGNYVYLMQREHSIVHFLRWKIYGYKEDLRASKMIGSGPKGLSFEDRSDNSKKVNNKRIQDGTHNFLREGYHEEFVSKIQRKMVEDGTHNFTSEFSAKHNKKRVEEGTHHFLGENNPSVRRSKEGTHQWIGLSAKRVQDGSHNFLGENNPSHKRVAEGTHNFTIEKECPHCGRKGKGAVMTRWHFDKCKILSL